MTFENVRKYLENTQFKQQLDIQLIYGDWRRIGPLLPSNYFDLILTTETIYNRSNYKPLLDLFSQCLNRQNPSFVLLGAKTYYFGCSGHLEDFLKVAHAKPYQFRSSSSNLLLLPLINSTSQQQQQQQQQNKEESVVSSKEIIKIYI